MITNGWDVLKILAALLIMFVLLVWFDEWRRSEI